MAALMTLFLHNYDVTIGSQGEGHVIANHNVGKVINNGVYHISDIVVG